MKKISTLLIISLLFIGVSSCKKDKAETKTPQQLILGKWKLTGYIGYDYLNDKIVSQNDETGTDQEYEYFESDGTGKTDINGELFATFKYNVSSSAINYIDLIHYASGNPGTGSQTFSQNFSEFTATKFSLKLAGAPQQQSDGTHKHVVIISYTKVN
jgi:hypothetical protein